MRKRKAFLFMPYVVYRFPADAARMRRRVVPGYMQLFSKLHCMADAKAESYRGVKHIHQMYEC